MSGLRRRDAKHDSLTLISNGVWAATNSPTSSNLETLAFGEELTGTLEPPAESIKSRVESRKEPFDLKRMPPAKKSK